MSVKEPDQRTLDKMFHWFRKRQDQCPGVFRVFCRANVVSATTVAPEVVFSVCGGKETKRTKGTTRSAVNNSCAFCKLNKDNLPDVEPVARFSRFLDERCKVNDEDKARFAKVEIPPVLASVVKLTRKDDGGGENRPFEETAHSTSDDYK